ncbi:HAD-IB family phosphatase, partial [Patescibacteria group bacterium]|nr:HAD-IB family phosphatase [Patescibacteria group bacterium]
ELNDLIFVDDGSTDQTEKSVQPYLSDPRFRYMKHPKNRGKGAALHTGVNHAKNEVILFLDADLANITAAKIRKIVKPVLTDEVDMSRGSFQMKRGRVTEFAVKPMMQILFPHIYFEQPISGQICAKKSFLKEATFSSSYGVDIGLLFDAIESGQRIIEVDIGKLEHKANSATIKQEMSRQVLEIMIERAGLIRHKYKMVLFTLDDTLIYPPSICRLFTALGIEEKMKANQELLTNGSLTAAEFLRRNARLFKGLEVEQVDTLCSAIPVARYVVEVIKALSRRKYRVGIISGNFSPIVQSFAQRLGVHYWNCVQLESKKGRYTGAIKQRSKDWLTAQFTDGFMNAYRKALRSQSVKSNETVMVVGNEQSAALINAAGLGIAYRPKNKALKEAADKVITVHAELLAIIE